MLTINYRHAGKRIGIQIFNDPFRAWCTFCKTGTCKHLELLADVATKREKSVYWSYFETPSGKILEFLDTNLKLLNAAAKEAEKKAATTRDSLIKEADEKLLKLKADLEVVYKAKEDEARRAAARSTATERSIRIATSPTPPILPTIPKPAPSPEPASPTKTRISLLELD